MRAWALVQALPYAAHGSDPSLAGRYSPQGYRAENDLAEAERVLHALNVCGYTLIRLPQPKRKTRRAAKR